MNEEMEERIIAFLLSSKREHYSCEEDTWYNCPAHPEAFNKYDVKDWKPECECGADKYNSEVDKLIAEIRDMC